MVSMSTVETRLFLVIAGPLLALQVGGEPQYMLCWVLTLFSKQPLEMYRSLV